MARTAKKKSAKVTANQSNAESASKHSSDTDVSELSSSQVSVDFLSDPNAPIEAVYESTPSVSPRESAGTDKEPDASEFPIHSTPIPKASKNKSKAKSNPEQKAKPQEKKTRKQSKPAPRKAHVEKEIRKLQDSVDLLIPKAPFQRCVREVMVSITNNQELRITGQALAALQVSTETYLTQLMEDAYLLASHRNRVTLAPRDIQLVLHLRGFSRPS